MRSQLVTKLKSRTGKDLGRTRWLGSLILSNLCRPCSRFLQRFFTYILIPTYGYIQLPTYITSCREFRALLVGIGIIGINRTYYGFSTPESGSTSNRFLFAKSRFVSIVVSSTFLLWPYVQDAMGRTMRIFITMMQSRLQVDHHRSS